MAVNKKVKSSKKTSKLAAKAKVESDTLASNEKDESSKINGVPLNVFSSMSSSRKFFFTVATLIVGIILVWSYIELEFVSDHHAKKKEQGSQIENAGLPQIGGPFVLINQDGKTVSEADFKGKYMLIYFGFTYCPDVCPTSLTTMEDALDILGDKAENITPIFITVDPERDDPEAMKTYVEYFHPRLVGLTGSIDQVKAVAKAYKVYFSKSGDGYKDDDYSVDHSSITYLMAPDGNFITHFSNGVEAETMGKKLAEILNE